MKQTSFWLIGIILLATVLRFYHLDMKMRFIWDEGRDMAAIYDLVAQKNLTLFGPYNEIDGHKDFFGVFHYYLMALPLFISGYDPLGPAVFTAILGVVSVCLVYLLVNQWKDTTTALIISGFYALSPLVIRFVQWPWNPNTTPFFALVYFLTLTHIFKRQQWSYLWVGIAGLLLGLAFQLHYFTLALVTPFLIMLHHCGKSLRNKIQLGFVFAIACALPNLTFVLFDLTHQFFYWHIIQASLWGNTSQKLIAFDWLRMVLYPFTFTQQTLDQLGVGQRASYLLTPVFLLLAVRCGKRYLKTRTVELGFLVAATYFLFLLSTSLFPTAIDQYHVAYLWWGFGFLLFDELQRLVGHKTFLGTLGIIAALILYHSYQSLIKPPDWSQNMPLIRQSAQIVINDLKNHSFANFNLAAFTDADTRGTRYRYFLLKNGFTVAGIDQYPNNAVIYIISPYDEITTKQNPAWEINSVRNQSWQLLGQESDLFIYKARNTGF